MSMSLDEWFVNTFSGKVIKNFGPSVIPLMSKMHKDPSEILIVLLKPVI